MEGNRINLFNGLKRTNIAGGKLLRIDLWEALNDQWTTKHTESIAKMQPHGDIS